MRSEQTNKEALVEEVRQLRLKIQELEDEKARAQGVTAEFSRVRNEWEQTFNAIPDPIMILDSRHRVVRLNSAMKEAVGAAQEVIGKNCYEVLHGSTGPIACCPHSQLLRDGREHFAEVLEPRMGGIFKVSVSPIRDKDGLVIGCVHVARDITALKKAEEDLREAGRELEKRVEDRTAELKATNDRLRLEIKEREVAQEALRSSEERFRAICESARDIIFIKDLEHRYTHVNPAMERLFSMPSSKIVGLTAENLYGERAGRHIREVELRVLAGDSVEEEHSRPVNGV